MKLNDYRYIRLVRQIRGLTIVKFADVMRVDEKTLRLLEKGQLNFSPLYKARFADACKLLKVSEVELLSIRFLIAERDGKRND
ncbi:helix-turn-helix domain-containing protein [Mesobacillus jeotgali]|uniref:XRE family transcriptional regulator n=1 Tax=Mesobacillus jeotgali TaxID=129985 RepID=UPI0015D64549|nr:XRE family transcriptional regulator [Mesobacillus jeotgali]